MKRDETTSLDLQGAVERFLDDVSNRRPESVSKGYSAALDLLLTYLAVELMDPESQEDDATKTATKISSLTPDLMRRYVTSFLVDRVGTSHKAMSKHILAITAFLRFLAGQNLMDPTKAAGLAEVLDETRKSLMPREDDLDPTSPPRLFRLVSFEEEPAFFQDLITARPLRAQISNPHDLDIESDRVYLISLSKGIRGPVATLLGLLDSPLVRLVETMDASNWSEEDGTGFESGLDDEDDWWDEDSDFDLMDDSLEPDFLSLTPTEALEILSIEDRFAPRKVVETILNHYDEVRSELLDWLHDEHLRSVPLPGLGEAPANAARILSEMGEMDIAPRLIEILGQLDPLGEETPPALARLGPSVLPALQRVLKEKRHSEDRRMATLWAMGYMAARHPTVRATILRILLEEILKGRPEAQTAITILGELRASEVLQKIRKAEHSGKLTLETFGYTIDLFEDQVSSPAYGETVGEILVPVVFLYPTDEQLDELYETVGKEMDDFLEDWPETDWDDDLDEPPPQPKPRRKPRPKGKPHLSKGKVIPFRPKDPDKDKE